MSQVYIISDCVFHNVFVRKQAFYARTISDYVLYAEITINQETDLEILEYLHEMYDGTEMRL